MARDVVTFGGDTWFDWDDHVAHIERLARNQNGDLDVVIVSDTGRTLRMRYADFCHKLSASLQNTDEDALTVPLSTEWEALPAEVRRRAVLRGRDLLQLMTGSPTGQVERDRLNGLLNPNYDPETTTKEQRLQAKIDELKSRQDRPWSRAQLLRQLAAFEADGLLGLVHQTRLQKRASDLPDDLATALNRALTGRRDRAQVGHSTLASITRGELTAQGFDLSVYSGRQWERIVAEASRSLALHRGAASRKTHNNKPQTVYGRRTVSRPGELVQIDATTTTIHCFFPDTGWGRATILTAIDVYSRCILAMRVVPGSPNSRDVGMLLWDIGRPMVTRAGNPYELRLWHGVPELAVIVDDPGPTIPHLVGPKPAVTPSMIVLDHGRENESIHLQSAAMEAGISIVYSPPGSPHSKGIVESLHNTLDTIESLLPAYKGANPANHPAGVEDEAVLTCGDLHDALWEYILTIYHHRPHSGLRDPNNPVIKPTPAEVFERFLTHGGEIQIPTDPWRMLAFLSRQRCTVQDYGVNLNNRIYNSSDLLALREHLQRGVGSTAGKLTIYYDRYDISRVYARHPLTQQWMMIPRWDPERLAAAPYSEVLSAVARRALIAGGTVRLTPTELQIAEARFHAAWASGRFTDRREQLLAAMERARAEAYAHDLGDATDEMRNLAFPPELPAIDPDTYVPFDLVPEQEDDDVFLYDDSDLDSIDLDEDLP